MGNFNTDPRQAHWIDFFEIRILITPMVVNPRTQIERIKALNTSISIKNIKPSAVSIKGYNTP